jgi:hypothetical protein
MNLSKNTKATLCSAGAAVGTTAVTGTTLDMSEFDGVLFLLVGGTITDGNLELKAQGGSAANGSDAADLAGTGTTLTNAQDNNVAELDLYRPLQRYITPVAVRGGSTGAVVQAIVAIQYSAGFRPTSQDATIAATNLVISPAYGTP